ncbi:sialidase family protein [Streptomyces sp. NPDC005574]|uniref:sialidase family protein n=1 Tax=Streptomyces sp. NPDC005574 TaxID=3156891 RepID=UPI0033A9386F
MALLSRALLVTAVFLTPFTAPHTSSAATRCVSSVPYVSGRDGYATYRIPAAVTTRRGTLLAFAEGRRHGAGDTGDIDVVLRRSTDGGCTWGPLQVVAAGDGDTRGNPAPVVDPRTGAVVLLTSFNSGTVTEAQIMRGEVPPEHGRRVFVQRSGNDGRDFSAPRDITRQVKPAGWRWYATGPGHAVALTRGPHAGRLVVPANHSAAPPAGSPDTGRESRYYGGHAIYSDDGGRSWRLGFVDGTYDGVTNANESSAAQLPDGRLYFSARDQAGSSPGNRLDSYSSDGARSLDRPYAAQPTLDDVPVVQGSVLHLDRLGGLLLFSGPSVPTARREMALWRSVDGGATFTKAVTLSRQRAAYSDLVRVGRGTVGVLYETGDTGTYDTIEFRRVDVTELRGPGGGGAPSLTAGGGEGGAPSVTAGRPPSGTRAPVPPRPATAAPGAPPSPGSR